MNITNYVKEFGDQPFAFYNMNYSDVMVLTALSYVDFSIVSRDFTAQITLRDAIDQLFSFSIQIPEKKKELLLEVRESKRFSNLLLSGYRNELDDLENPGQFSAVTIQISDFLYFISYSGTDGTIIGWKEDFQFSYLSQTTAQEKALQYLKEAADTLKGSFILSGHSKGGNLAAYAAIFAEETLQNRLHSVFCNDAPGFNKNMKAFDCDGYYRIADKIHCIIPQNSIFGQLLQIFPSKHYFVIFSKAKNLLLEHDIFNWQIDENGQPHWLEHVNGATKIVVRKINHTIGAMSMQQREIFTNNMFKWMENKNISHLEQIKLYFSI